MTLLLEHYARITDGFGRRLDAVTADQWGDPTPCTDWDVRQLVAHVLDEQLWLEPLLGGQTIADVGDRFAGDQLGEDPAAAWKSAREGARAATGRPGALDGTVQLSYGEERADNYLWQVTADTLIHSWDLARAIGGDEQFDPDDVAAVSAFLGPQIDVWRAAGAFGPEVPEPDTDDPLAHLLARTGRKA